MSFRTSSLHAGIALALGLATAPGVCAAPAPDSTAVPAIHHPLLWTAATVAAIGVAAGFDRRLDLETDESHPIVAHQLARTFQPLGNGVVLASGVALTYGAARLFHRPGLADAAVRVGAADFVAAAGALVLKEAVGRRRPDDAPGDPWSFHPFSGDRSFPSGHATLAFATAVAVDRETRAAWVPWVVYPAATLVGWSRIRDDGHWLSDVAAGAALGAWSATLVENRLQRHEPHWLARLAWGIEPGRDGILVCVTAH